MLLFKMKTFKAVKLSSGHVHLIYLVNMVIFHNRVDYLIFPTAKIDSAFKGGFSSAVSMAMFSPNGSLLCAVGADGEAGKPELSGTISWVETIECMARIFKKSCENIILIVHNIDQLPRDLMIIIHYDLL